MTVRDLVKLLRYRTNEDAVIKVNVPSLRAGDEGPMHISHIEYDQDEGEYVIELED